MSDNSIPIKVVDDEGFDIDIEDVDFDADGVTIKLDLSSLRQDVLDAIEINLDEDLEEFTEIVTSDKAPARRDVRIKPDALESFIVSNMRKRLWKCHYCGMFLEPPRFFTNEVHVHPHPCTLPPYVQHPTPDETIQAL